jgi:hypothetical protein
MHVAISLAELFALDAWMLAGWITFGAVQGSRGLTVDVVFLVILLRRKNDEGYAGDLTQECNLYIGLSRVRDVLHIFIQDIRPAVQASASRRVEPPRRGTTKEALIPKDPLLSSGKGAQRLCTFFPFLVDE